MAPRGALFTIVDRCSRSWRVRWRLEIDRKADRVIWGLFAPRSAVDAQREDLHVQAEAADRAAGEQFKCPGTGRALGLSVGAVSKYLRAVRSSGISASDAEALSEVELEQRVFGPTLSGKPGAFVRRTVPGSMASSSATGM